MGKELQLVSFEQAKKLKEMGFDYPVTYHFATVEGRSGYSEWQSFAKDLIKNYNLPMNNKIEYFSRPTIQHAFMWLRNEKGIVPNVRLSVDNPNKFYASWYCKEHNSYYGLQDLFEVYEDAEYKLLNFILAL